MVDAESGSVTNDSLPCPDLDWRCAQLFNKPWVIQLKPLNSEMQTRVHALHMKQGTLPRDRFRKPPHPASIYSLQEGGAQREIHLIFNFAVGGGGVPWLHPVLSGLYLGICFPSLSLVFFICKLGTIFLECLTHWVFVRDETEVMDVQKLCKLQSPAGLSRLLSACLQCLQDKPYLYPSSVNTREKASLALSPTSILVFENLPSSPFMQPSLAMCQDLSLASFLVPLVCHSQEQLWLGQVVTCARGSKALALGMGLSLVLTI